MAAIGQPTNTAREPVQGEAQIMEEQQAAAPIAARQQTPPPPPDERPIDNPAAAPLPPSEEPLNPGNLLRVLPPEPTAPPTPLSAQEQLGYAILAMPGASPIARRLAAQLVGNLGRNQRMQLVESAPEGEPSA